MSDRAAFIRDGVVLRRGVAAPELLRQWRDPLARATLARCSPGAGAAFMPITDLWRLDETARAFTFHQPFARIAAELLGVDRVRLYHDQAMFTEAGGAATPWHQDAQHWSIAGDRCLTMWLALDPVPDACGTLTYVHGSQRAGLLGDWPIGHPAQQFFAEHIRAQGAHGINAGAMAAGDALFHDGWVIHGAPANRTQHLRAVMTVLYVADGTPLITPMYPDQQAALAQWSPGQSPGELFAGPLLC